MNKTKGRFVGAARIGSRVYLAVMAAVFAKQAWDSVNKFLERKLVEEISFESRMTASLPPLTLCFMPGQRKIRENQIQFRFETVCPEEETRNDTKKCIEDTRFNLDNFLLLAFVSSGRPKPPNMQHWRPSSFNLVTGSCFTYHTMIPMELSQGDPELVILNMTDNELSRGWSLMAFVHNQDMFIPTLSIGPDYVGQVARPINPKGGHMTWLTIDVTLRMRMNTPEHRCTDNTEHNVVRCMEEYVASKVGCVSPWDLYSNITKESFPACETYDDFMNLHSVHLAISVMSAPLFTQTTGCLPACSHEQYEVDIREMHNPVMTDIFDNTTEVAIALAAYSSNRQVKKDAILYDGNSLIGEVGGSLGLFLGISLMSLSEAVVGLVGRKDMG